MESRGGRLDEGEKWTVIGDFNCILREDEKRGGLRYDMAKSREFQHCVGTCGLREVSYYGNTFTWWNGRRGSQAVWKRLDRAFMNEGWENAIKSHIQHLSKATSDHSPLVMEIEPQIKWAGGLLVL